MSEEVEKHHITFTAGYCEPVVFHPHKWRTESETKPNDIDRIVSAFRNFLETNYVDDDDLSLGLQTIDIKKGRTLSTIHITIRDYDDEEEDSD